MGDYNTICSFIFSLVSVYFVVFVIVKSGAMNIVFTSPVENLQDFHLRVKLLSHQVWVVFNKISFINTATYVQVLHKG